jgi:hypothetical protein
MSQFEERPLPDWWGSFFSDVLRDMRAGLPWCDFEAQGDQILYHGHGARLRWGVFRDIDDAGGETITVVYIEAGGLVFGGNFEPSVAPTWVFVVRIDEDYSEIMRALFEVLFYAMGSHFKVYATEWAKHRIRTPTRFARV